MACENKDLYHSLEWCQGKPILPGIRKRLYYTPKRTIVKFPTLPGTVAVAGKMGDLATYEGDFVLTADTKWRYMDVLIGESPVTSDAQGDIPCVTSLNKATFKHPGTEEEATAFARQANNDDIVYLFQQKNGKFRVLGNEMYETVTKVKQELGSGATDKAGTTSEIEVTDLCPAPFYKGKILTEEGTISGADGSAEDPAPEV